MKFGKIISAAVFAASVAAASAASALVIEFENDLTEVFVDVTGGVPVTVGEVTFSVTAGTFTNPDASGNVSIGATNPNWISQNSEGLGVNRPFDSSEVDGSFGNDILLFSFLNTQVALSAIVFENVDNNDDMLFYSPEMSPNSFSSDIFNPILGSNELDEGIFQFEPDFIGTTFGIGAVGSLDNFRVARLKLTAVPLPAAGWMLLAGVGGLAAMKRRRKA